MIETRAIVRSVGAEGIRVQALNPGNCPRCAEGRGCGGGILSRLTQQARPDILVSHADIPLAEGETVVLGLEEGALLTASVWVYLVPLGSMLGLGALADVVFGAPDPVVMLFGFTGLSLGLGWLSRRARRAGDDPRFRPVILRKLTATDDHCPRMGD